MTALLLLLGPDTDERKGAERRAIAWLAQAAGPGSGPLRQFRERTAWWCVSPGPAVIRQRGSIDGMAVEIDSEGRIGLPGADLPGHAVRWTLEATGEWTVRRGWHAERNAYVGRAHGLVAIATSPSLVLATLGLPFVENDAAIAAFFALQPLDPPSCFFAGVDCLAPGQAWRFDASGRSIDIPEDPGYEPEVLSARSDQAWLMTFDERLRAALAAHAGDGPTGLMLSGGIDSTTLAAGLAANGQDARLYCWALEREPSADESGFAVDTARALRLPLRRVVVDQLPFADLDRLPLQPDSPLANPYRALNDAVMAAAAEDGVTTLMSGNFGDHLYPEPRQALRSAWRSGRPGLAAGQALVRVGARVRRALSAPRRAHGPHASPWTDHALALLAEQAAPVLPDLRPEDPTRLVDLFGTAARIDAEGAWWFAERLGIDVRFPYRHAGLIDLALAWPVHVSERLGTRKWLVRRWLASRVPESVSRRPKSGSLAPWFWRGWQQHQCTISELLFQSRNKWQTFMNRDAIGTRSGVIPSEVAGLRVWQAVCYEIWRSRMSQVRYH